MQRSIHNPPGLLPMRGASHAVAVSGAQRLVFVSGQVACDSAGQVLEPGDLAAQARIAFENLGRALAAAGSGFGDLTRVNIYVVELETAHIELLRDIRAAYFPPDAPAVTLVGVTRLAFPGLRIEIEAIAASAV